MPIDWLTWGAAALAGLMGGVHCVAMCGGIDRIFSNRRNRWMAPGAATQPGAGDRLRGDRGCAPPTVAVRSRAPPERSRVEARRVRDA